MHKVKGYTIIETLLALTVIVVSVGIGFMIFENLMQSDSMSQKMMARNEMDSFLLQKKYLTLKEGKVNDRMSFVVKRSNWKTALR